MKTIPLSIILLFFFTKLFGQSSDIMYVPDQNSVVVSYNNHHNGIGMYLGGYLTTSFPAPYIYTTPMSRFNRIGLSWSDRTISVMGGVYRESFIDNTKINPDFWFKIYPIRLIAKTKIGPDFTLGVNYMKGFRYGVGLSIDF